MKNMGEEDRVRMVKLAGDDKARGIVMDDLARKSKFMAGELQRSLGGKTEKSVEDISKLVDEARNGSEAAKKELKAMFKELPDQQQGALQSTLSELTMDTHAVKAGGTVGTGEAMANLSAGAALEIKKAALQRFGGGEKLSNMTGMQGYAARKAAGMSQEEFRGMAKLQDAVADQKDAIVASLENPNEAQKKIIDRLADLGIVMSLEKSANEGQLLFHGMDINHQYSKSEEFEEDLRNYVSKYIDGEVEYFSLLRGYNELRIAEIFAGLEDFDKYAPVFSSCNANFKINKTEVPKRWCGHCPKCAFVFLILAAFVPREKLLGIFGENLLNKPELMELHEELLGLRNFKPFECVGTIEESQIAFWLIAQKPEWQNDLLVKYFVTDLAPRLPISDWETAKAKVLKTQETPMIAEVFKQYLPK
jgi:hypothetical protein